MTKILLLVSLTVLFTFLHAQDLPPVNININIIDPLDAAPDYPEKVKNLAIAWDPFIANLLASDGYTPPRDVTFTFEKGLKVPAYADWSDNNTIHANSDSINSDPGTGGMMIHEYVHIVQKYPGNQFGEDDTWVTEGIADYVRYIYFEPQPDNPTNPTPNDSWFQQNEPKPTGDYRTKYGNAARFLFWIEQKRGIAELVKELNKVMRAGTYQPSIFPTLTGQTVDDLWNAYADEIGVPELKIQVGKSAAPSRLRRRCRPLNRL